jgi:Flp pilus assembly protein TadG
MTRTKQIVNQRGAVALEFALLLPVFLVLLFGTIEFGRMMYGREIVTNAAREGARAGIVARAPVTTKPSAGAITAIANNYLTGTGISPASVTFTPVGAMQAYPAALTVNVQYQYTFLIPYIPAVVGIPNPLIINTQVVMIHE